MTYDEKMHEISKLALVAKAARALADAAEANGIAPSALSGIVLTMATKLWDANYGAGKWVDPAGGVHTDDEEDPAKMYE